MEQQKYREPQPDNDTFIDRKLSSLASSRGKPPVEQCSFTIILQTTFSYLLLLFILVLPSKEHSRGRSF
jgi:hypothetical protein